LRWVSELVNTRELETGTDAIATSTELAHWLRERGLLPRGARVTAAQHRRALIAREGLRALIARNNQPTEEGHRHGRPRPPRREAPEPATDDVATDDVATDDAATDDAAADDAAADDTAADDAATDGDGFDAVDPGALEALADLTHRLALVLDVSGDRPRLVPRTPGTADAALAAILGVVADAVARGTWSRLKACREPGCRWAYYDQSRNRSRAWCSMSICGNRAKARAFRRRSQ
jgi:hypothetical protein